MTDSKKEVELNKVVYTHFIPEERPNFLVNQILEFFQVIIVCYSEVESIAYGTSLVMYYTLIKIHRFVY
jgi:hypothetical protein